MSKEVIVVKLPKCDLCAYPAQYDAPMKDGRWAFMCETHYLDRRMFRTLGLGKGQRLVTQKELQVK
jgi:hypothetical protein